MTQGPVVSMEVMGAFGGAGIFDSDDCRLLDSFLSLAPLQTKVTAQSCKASHGGAEAGVEVLSTGMATPTFHSDPTAPVHPSAGPTDSDSASKDSPDDDAMTESQGEEAQEGAQEAEAQDVTGTAAAGPAAGKGGEQTAESQQRLAGAPSLRRKAKTAEALRLMAEHTKDRRRESARRARARKTSYVKTMEMEHSALRQENQRLRAVMMRWVEQGFMDPTQARDFIPLHLQRDCLALMAGGHALAAPQMAAPLQLEAPSIDNLFNLLA